jgi:hypothetical protein
VLVLQQVGRLLAREAIGRRVRGGRGLGGLCVVHPANFALYSWISTTSFYMIKFPSSLLAG